MNSVEDKKNFYITTTLPYVNSEPHIGFAMELVRADIVARYKKLMGHEVFFNTGTDEHGVKVWRKAHEQGKDIQKYVDESAEKFKELIPALNVLPEINFVRTTDAKHVASAQEFWTLCEKKGDIYKKNYSVKYCVGCELEKTESELVEGKCPLHPNLELEIIEEENYFFRFSKYQKQLVEFYEKNRDFVIPESRLNEIKKFVERGLEDFSISRLKSKMPWGVPVPKDADHVMYVWFDALVNYISVLGWPASAQGSGEAKPGMFEKFWVEGETVQYCGKDNLRQQSAMWQAMLFSAGLPNSKKIVIDGFITSGGQKMSKSLGNVIDPFEIVSEYGADALRYYLAREISSFEDGDFTMEKFKEAYNANLANGIGNLASRILKMAVSNDIKLSEEAVKKISEGEDAKKMHSKQDEAFKNFNIQQATDAVWEFISNTDKIIQNEEPFKVIKSDKAAGEVMITDLLARLEIVGEALLPILPETSQKIKQAVKGHKMFDKPLFPRKD